MKVTMLALLLGTLLGALAGMKVMPHPRHATHALLDSFASGVI
jgi:hypothetical protein